MRAVRSQEPRAYAKSGQAQEAPMNVRSTEREIAALPLFSNIIGGSSREAGGWPRPRRASVPPTGKPSRASPAAATADVDLRRRRGPPRVRRAPWAAHRDRARPAADQARPGHRRQRQGRTRDAGIARHRQAAEAGRRRHGRRRALFRVLRLGRRQAAWRHAAVPQRLSRSRSCAIRTGVTGHIIPWNYPAQIFGRSVGARSPAATPAWSSPPRTPASA